MVYLYILTLLHSEGKIAYNFGLSECSRVSVQMKMSLVEFLSETVLLE